MGLEMSIVILDGIQSPADAMYGIIRGKYLFITLTLAGVGLFSYIAWKRLRPLLRAAPDPRWSKWPSQTANVLKYWLAQWKQPRYLGAGILHIFIFAGFLTLLANTISVTLLGFVTPDHIRFKAGGLSSISGVIVDGAESIVFVAAALAAIRRIIFKPARYVSITKAHRHEAIVILGLIAGLMLSASLFDVASSRIEISAAAQGEPLVLGWFWTKALETRSESELASVCLGAYLVHQLILLSFLCLLPFGKHFHVVTSFVNVLFARSHRGQVKPVRWGVTEQELAQAKSLGVKTFEDFTWKHMLDLYSCADCGRCSEQCPSHATGRPLSPRAFTIKARNHCFEQYPIFHGPRKPKQLVGAVYSEDEIWSCTTCGACEEECPLLLEYIDKIVDLRRGLVDGGRVPASLQKPMKALESRGNPYGKLQSKRADWIKSQSLDVPVANGSGLETLYFVDSITSYDGRMQSIARATARVLQELNEDFGILGPAEKDSGHEARRFGEEMLFFLLRDQNTGSIKHTGARSIVVSDPHAYNALKHDYKDLPPVRHVSEVMASAVESGRLQFRPVGRGGDVYTLHDACYLGRHNQIYDPPRNVLDAIPGLKRIEMERCRDRSFCCGGGGLMLFYEPKQEERMGVVRVRMAADAGANVIVTSCPYCLANLEDAIKVAGMEDKMMAIDLAELASQQMVFSTKTAQ